MQPLTRLHQRLDYAFKVRNPQYTLTIPRRHYRIDTANGLQAAIVAFIQSYGYQAERVNTTGIPRATPKGVRWTHSGSTTGSADVHATIQGRSCKFEIKIGKDTQSDAQRKYAEQIRRAGGVYEVIDSLQTFFDWWDQQSIVDILRYNPEPLQALPDDATLPDQSPRSRPVQVASDQVLAEVLKFKELDKE